MNHDRYPDAYIRAILDDVKSVAIVGASHKDVRPSHFVARYLLDKGYRIYPINPGLAGKAILGQTVYGSLPSPMRST
jgi:predicted CoA-binding protein